LFFPIQSPIAGTTSDAASTSAGLR